MSQKSEMLEFNKSIIGMVHVQALPGTPQNVHKIDAIVSKALSDAKKLEDAGVDAVMVENMHDRPYLNRKVGPEITAAMTTVALALRHQLQLPLGIQILAGANREALAVALAAGFDFIRAEGFVFGHLADEGMMNSDAAELLRYRQKIGAGHIRVLTDIKKKHSAHALSADVSVAETAKAAEFFLSDGVIVTGSSTGMKPSTDDLEQVKKAVNIPVLIGSGIDVSNIGTYWPLADAFIVGSSLKYDGYWENDVDPDRLAEFMKKVGALRKK
jgi:membrane complex biogenesis BtpA family protein